MLTREQTDLLKIHVTGYALVIGQAFVVSILALWGLQVLAIALEESHDWPAILRQIFLSLCFLAFFPGQQFWTFRVEDKDGRVHTIIGAEVQAD